MLTGVGAATRKVRSGLLNVRPLMFDSISDHMCRMALMAMMIPADPLRPLDIPRCVMVSLRPAGAKTAKLRKVDGVGP